MTSIVPPLFLVGTRFQALMVQSILEHLRIAAFDLVVYHQEGEILPEEDYVLSSLMNQAREVTRIDRKTSTGRQFIALLRAAGTQSRTVFLAQINRPFVLALFRLRPGMRLCTFDEGGYNVAPNGPFHAPRWHWWRHPRGFLAFALFPRGPVPFARRRTRRHYTAFPPQQNILSARAERIEIPWASFLLADEMGLASARKIMVLPCMKDFTGPPQLRAAIIAVAQSCDLVVRHPRDAPLEELETVQLRSPVESLLCAAAECAPVEVTHYASTVRLTLAGRPNISLLDMSDTSLT